MKNILFTIIVILNFCSCSVSKNSAVANQKDNPFFAYNFGGLENLSPEDQIKTLKNFGYDGISLRMAKAEHVKNLEKFIEIADKTEGFRIYSVFVRYNFGQSETDRNRWKEVVDIISAKGIDLWFIFGKEENGITAPEIESILRNVVDYSAKNKVPVTLYPHSHCYFYSAEQTLPIVKKINHPNLKLAVHSCHEMKAGNINRMAEVVENVKGYISFVTIAGADNVVDMSSERAMNNSTIQALEDGDYDYANFFKALKKINYRGPVGFINFNVKKDLNDYLPKTLQEWERLKNNYLKY